MRKNFTAEQMLHTVRQAEHRWQKSAARSGSQNKLYKWKRWVAGMGIAELTRLRQLEDENKN